jgi:hypothetical protein
MGHHEGGASGGGREQLAAEHVSGCRVEVRGGLVEQKHRTVGQEGARHGELLALAARDRPPRSPTKVSRPSGKASNQSPKGALPSAGAS